MSSKIKHSKIRNTGILFELLTRQITVDVLNNDKKGLAAKMMKTFFNKSPADTLEYFQNMLLRTFSPRLFGISYIPIYFKDNKLKTHVDHA